MATLLPPLDHTSKIQWALSPAQHPTRGLPSFTLFLSAWCPEDAPHPHWLSESKARMVPECKRWKIESGPFESCALAEHSLRGLKYMLPNFLPSLEGTYKRLCQPRFIWITFKLTMPQAPTLLSHLPCCCHIWDTHDQ